ncbi:E3 ubiquitin-protein ligase ATL9 isoform X2 [Eurytemora carolleeae]|uniref:E3 ubiquitin-protein ligase ATL9 isoform X2 n=1 Tax=Eurytemora carolleeae TaxID=1294199 RepID=UPI000C76700C|nr:E3 ubiquitin-protein ligase ATL9 isoform X2 [Eurytemora carolleeae]|eukprot:XP_023330066.1 E3 ubiquitin-protein ligase ATL9-like isoform X2 [Eurytemora affinis]
MGSSMSGEMDEGLPPLNYQVAMSNRLFNDDVSLDDLPCMNCLRVEMGERACYTGICDNCGQTPPSLRWMYPDAPIPQPRHTRRRYPRLSEVRSQSTDRPDPVIPASRRRLSVDSIQPGISLARIETCTFTHNYRRVVGVDSSGEDKDTCTCVICIQDFVDGAKVRRLGCLHIFHVNCVDAWLARNRCCPVCRVDIEEAAAQFR